tara:strand:- start:1891 stop:3477 length:1587 start_codon:yes stop_codon:yes gene_type:complete
MVSFIDNRSGFRGYKFNPSKGIFASPTYTGNTRIPLQNNATMSLGIGNNRGTGRSYLDNVYGLSSDKTFQANPPSVFRTKNAINRGLFDNRFSALPVTNNVNEEKLLEKIPENLRQYAKIVNGQVVFDMPEELETPDMRVPGVSNQPNIEQANQGILNFKPKSNQENIEIANKGLLNTSEETVNEQKPKMTMKGLLDKAVAFAQSDFGKDFFMGMDTGYSDTPKTLMQTIQSGYNYAKQQEQVREKLDIERLKANKDDPRGQPVYRYMIRDKNGQNYNVFSDKGQMYAMVDGKRVYQKDWQKTLGNIDVRTAGQQTFGVMGSGPFTKLEGELLDQEKSLQSYARFLDTIGDTNIGLERLTDKYSAWFKTFFGQDLTQEELSQQLANGELQRMIGASRKEIVGGGVMTEQDALRIIEALGGNIDALQDPERVKKAISQIFSEKYNKYEQNLRNYNIQVRNEYGTKGYKSKNPIEFTKEQLKRFDAGITTDLGLLDYSDLDDDDLRAINHENLNTEQLKLYLAELEKRKL